MEYRSNLNFIHRFFLYLIYILFCSTTSSFHKPYLYNPFSSKYFRWIGKGRIVKVLEPFCSERIELLAAVFAPGTYDLGARIEILCHRTDEPQNVVLETCRIDSALIVISSNS